jgi:Epoxide hydrolase N terminus
MARTDTTHEHRQHPWDFKQRDSALHNRRCGRNSEGPGRATGEHALAASRMAGSSWDRGMDPTYLRELVEYRRGGYDWRNEQQKLNQFAHYRTEIDGVGIHFVYERGKGPAPFPLILTSSGNGTAPSPRLAHCSPRRSCRRPVLAPRRRRRLARQTEEETPGRRHRRKGRRTHPDRNAEERR